MRRNNFFRLLRDIFSFFPVKLPVMIFLILFCAAVNTLPSVFIQKVIALIENSDINSSWPDVSSNLLTLLVILAGLYMLSLTGGFLVGQIGADITQGVLMRFREKMFGRMQNLPLRFFDSNSHGDIMSHYTNDVDSLRQLVSQAMPQMLTSIITITAVISIMLYFSLWMTLVTFTGIIAMFIVTKKKGGRSAHHFRRQQKNTGQLEGFAEEIMNGQKVVKVFCHEEESIKDFERLNEELFTESEKANKKANTLGPILNNIGNILYASMSVAGGILILSGVRNVSFSGLPMSISVVVPFLNMTKQFAMNINHFSMHINAIVSGLAGAGRIYAVIDSEPEDDNGKIEITRENSEGKIEFIHVNFGYENDIDVLHDITLSAKPGQKTALVGSTGAGKTTIANLIPRFYDANSGKILYDGINIQGIKKSSLRKILGIVLQDTNLFTGTVLENIRYGNLNASDEECINAAKLAGADEFISRLPDAYDTMLSGNGSNLSQGQRQLIAISRAAVADPIVMILDEATSSIDTRTEALVQRGMDALMKDRTVFVIAHRLSTVRNADMILVMEHGRIIERGTHDELIALKGRYYKLYTGAFELS
ncbi:MAG: ABC transporter ATP-binding protein [Synergistaceae bacterium]|nr:ABC transporter ATP-binding protein [Synergistaceae bacterium]MBQ3693446.1 ABC transporter ATP-binding protein [Synergistaceae bacterium]MBQ9629281.1 ABC transporter ATP-binding protein [Synergistaceae bacterium]MBR0251328.1 ABC transporter ATP-binding protein [Synergistaceae bacterium]